MPNLQVVLLEDIPDLGNIGDIRSVAAGYVRNYLLPKKLVVLASERRLADSQFHASLERRRQDAERQVADRIAEGVQGSTITLAVQVGDKGRMHGQITNKDVATALAEQLGVEIDRHGIQIDSPIRSLGRYLLPINVAAGLNVSVTLEVVDKQEAEEEAEERAEAVQLPSESNELDVEDDEES